MSTLYHQKRVAALRLHLSNQLDEFDESHFDFTFHTPHGRHVVLAVPPTASYDQFLCLLWNKCIATDHLVNTYSQYTLFEALPINPSEIMYVKCNGKILDRCEYDKLRLMTIDNKSIPTLPQQNYLQLNFRLLGGIDRQNRVGSKFGGGGVSSAQQSERERKERLRQLALETVDLAKDPYLMRNHLGTYECKLCLTLHTNEGNYLAHTQGKKHQAGLAKRAAMEAKLKCLPVPDGVGPSLPSTSITTSATNILPRVKIGRPGYEIQKSRHYETNQRSLSFSLQFPEIENHTQPRHRFMSAFEQRIESPPDRRYQYLLVAAEPYETVGFKIPNEPIDRRDGMFVTNWDVESKTFTLTLYFVDGEEKVD